MKKSMEGKLVAVETEERREGGRNSAAADFAEAIRR
jgi:hypothetical protein